MTLSAIKLLRLSTLFAICQPSIFPSNQMHPLAKLASPEFYYVEAEYDWNGDGIKDRFRLRVQKEMDSIVEGLGETPSKNQRWLYHCWLLVESGSDDSSLWEDEWSIKERDLTSFREMLNFQSPDKFFSAWFRWKYVAEQNQELNFNSFEVRQLEDPEVNEDVLANEMKRLKIEGITAPELKREILNNKSSRIFVYRGSQRADIRWTMYVPRLRKVMMFQSGFVD